jgi:two-component system, LuxR family, response regulator FixJ
VATLTNPHQPRSEVFVNPHIGVVDDDPSILRALRRLLGLAGFRVTTFGSGEELLAYDKLGSVDCLVLDIHLDGLSGFDIQERLARRQPATPIVFITAHDDPGTRDRAQRAAQYLRKPFDESSLVQAITSALAGA